MLLNELRAWGFDTETVDNIQAIKSHVEEEIFDILIVDPLCTSEDDRVILESLTRYLSYACVPARIVIDDGSFHQIGDIYRMYIDRPPSQYSRR
jgi:hypothetical protein